MTVLVGATFPNDVFVIVLIFLLDIFFAIFDRTVNNLACSVIL